MLGTRSPQRGFLEADHLYLDHVGRGSFYGMLPSLRGRLFQDQEFGELYRADNGRNSVPPTSWPPLSCSRLTTGCRMKRPSSGPTLTFAGR